MKLLIPIAFILLLIILLGAFAVNTILKKKEKHRSRYDG